LHLDGDHQLTAALDGRAAGVPVSPADLADVHSRARSIRRRRVAAGGVAGAAVVALVVPVAWGLGGLRGHHEAPVAPQPATSSPAVTCSSTGIARPSAPTGLPAPVLKTWQEIVDAAAACDFDALEAIGHETTTSFGDPQGISNLRTWEQQGHGELGVLLEVLGTTPGLGTDPTVKVYGWPAVSVRDSWQPLTAQERAELGTFESPDAVAAHDRDRMYYGMRVGIRDDGTWSYFVSGD
jgi:hypothetical protein